MKRPGWWQNQSLVSFVLLPIALTYALVDLLIRLFTSSKSVTLPVICVDDFVLEGERVMEFLADICFSHLTIREYIERKENIIKLKSLQKED